MKQNTMKMMTHSESLCSHVAQMMEEVWEAYEQARDFETIQDIIQTVEDTLDTLVGDIRYHMQRTGASAVDLPTTRSV